MFNVFDLSRNQLLIDSISEEPFIWDTGSDARDFCTMYNIVYGEGRKILEPRRIALENNWKEREAKKFEDGIYTLPEFIKPYALPDHFLHLATDKKSLAYTKDSIKGQQDLRTKISFPGYLEKYWFQKISDSTRFHLLSLWEMFLIGVDGISFAITPNEIEAVYKNFAYVEGVASSCMRGSFSHLPAHPTRVYGAGDLAVAYLADVNKLTVARSLVWPAKRIYGRVYGNSHLHNLLKDRGYRKSAYFEEEHWSESISFAGAKLLRIPFKKGFVVPYLDEPRLKAVDKGDYLILERVENDALSNTRFAHGTTLSGIEINCFACGEDISDEGRFLVNSRDRITNTWCRDCSRLRTFVCDFLQERFELEPNSTLEPLYRIRMWDGSYWSRFAFDRYGFICQKTGKNRHTGQRRLVYTSGGIQQWCLSALKNFGWTCWISNLHYSNSIPSSTLITSTGDHKTIHPSSLIGREDFQKVEDNVYKLKDTTLDVTVPPTPLSVYPSSTTTGSVSQTIVYRTTTIGSQTVSRNGTSSSSESY